MNDSFQIITVGKEGEAAAFLSWQDPQPFYINYFGVCTGWGANGTWIIDDAQNLGWGGGIAQQLQHAPSAPGGTPCWVPSANGQVPPGAVVGGQDGEPMFVARARHGNALIPGKLVPSHQVAYIAYGGGEHPHADYEVLCGCNPQWVPVSGSQIHPSAIPAGEGDDGEPLFIGRVQHEGSLTVGKVQVSFK